MRFVCSKCKESMEVMSIDEKITYVTSQEGERTETAHKVQCGSCGNIVYYVHWLDQEVDPNA